MQAGITLAVGCLSALCMAAQNIFLVGLMAVGKTTIGRLLADAINWQFVDSDHVIEERAGADIPWIFDVEGEVGFRDREQAVIAELSHNHGLVLATGGGAVLRMENRQALASNGVVIHLDSSLAHLLERTRRDKKRPLLNPKANPDLKTNPALKRHTNSGEVSGSPPLVPTMRETLQRLQCERGPLYAEIADYRFTTDNSSPKVLARHIEQRLRSDGVLD